MQSLPGAYSFLFIAIVSEILGTTLLAKSEQFTKFWPTLGMAVAYAFSFYVLTLVIRVIPLSVAYALWSALGIVFTAIIGTLVLEQPVDTPALVGIALIMVGVVFVTGFSSTLAH